MSADRVPSDLNHWHLHQAQRCVQAGGIIAYPTEAVWGVGCNPADDEALQRLLALKQRPWQKGLILIASDWSQLQPWLAIEAPPAITAEFWPGHTTCLLPARPEVTPWLRGVHNTLAVRISAHPVVRALCQRCDSALVSTSANRHGYATPRSAWQLHLHLGRDLDYLLPGALGQGHKASRIINPYTGELIRS